MNPFDAPEQPRERITGKHVAAVVIMAILIMLPFAGLIYKQRVDEAAKAEAVRVANIQKEQTKKVLAAMKQDYPRKSESKEKEMADIARGTTGPADYTTEDCGGSDYNEAPFWRIMGPPSGEDIAWTTNPQGWDCTPEGVVTVPANAAVGSYTATFYFDDPDCPTTDPESPRWRRVDYQFQVVCVKITLSPVRVK